MIPGRKAYMLIAIACPNFTSAPKPKLNVAISTPAITATKMIVIRGEAYAM